jgi:hypothetical protein
MTTQMSSRTKCRSPFSVETWLLSLPIPAIKLILQLQVNGDGRLYNLDARRGEPQIVFCCCKACNQYCSDVCRKKRILFELCAQADMYLMSASTSTVRESKDPAPALPAVFDESEYLTHPLAIAENWRAEQSCVPPGTDPNDVVRIREREVYEPYSYVLRCYMIPEAQRNWILSHGMDETAIQKNCG